MSRLPRSGDLWTLMRAELGEERLGPRDGQPGERRPLMGIALSGGGIRSATFNLGLLQGLHGLGILRRFDYLSTVSGGGYIGGFWTRWLDRHRGPIGDEVFPSRGPAAGERQEPRPIQHLREFSNFLSPRMGVFSHDTGRMVAAAVNAMIPAILASLSLLFLLSFGWLLMARVMFGGTAASGALGLGLVTLLVCGLFEWRWRRAGEPWDPGGTLVAWVLCLAAPIVTWWLVLSSTPVGRTLYPDTRLLPAIQLEPLSLSPLGLFAPASAWTAAILTIVLGRTLFSRHTNTIQRRSRRAAFERAQGRLAFLVAAWCVLTVLWMLGVVLEAWVIGSQQSARLSGLAGLVAALGALFAKVQQLAGRRPNAAGEVTLLARLKPLLPQVLAYLTIVLLLVSIMAVITVLASSPAASGAVLVGVLLSWPLLAVVMLAVGISLVTLFFFAPNEIGIHSFYRGRLVRAYLGASDPHGTSDDPRVTEELPDDDIHLDRLRRPAGGPFHLICCAANDLSGDALKNLNRGARSAVLSRVGFSVDGHWARWPVFRDEVPTLGAAMTASGAAFNSLMGSHSVRLGPAVTYLMATLNLRLGLWLPHPAWLRSVRGRRNWLPGRPFYREMFGRAAADGREVHISDGGHFENTGIYELVRRQCQVIIGSDCGADPDVAFDDVANLVRRVRQDFGADIRIDLSPLRADPVTGLARQPMVAGDIHYRDGSTGTLLLVKPAMVGTEPADVAQYDRRNPGFPHESTGDQFYDEAQWEAYRRLGEHAARSAFHRIKESAREMEPEELFARARREWQPTPAGFQESLARFSEQIAELDSLLRQDGCETLLRQVYKEIPELDRQVVQIPSIVALDGDSVRTVEPARVDEIGLRPEDLAPSLHLIRRMLLVMYEVYERDDLERNSSHPSYLGLLNYFARWAYAPLFRMWWPLLKALYPQPFARYVEKQYGLGAGPETQAGDVRVTTWVDGDDQGFATNSWVRQRGGRGPDAGRELISYHLAMRYREAQGYSVQAALVQASRHDSLLIWDAGEFYVPPGLWGIGIGTDFLRLLGRGLDRTGVEVLVARLSRPTDTGASALKSAADEVQLYRTAGYRAAGYVDGYLHLPQGRVLELPEEWRVRPASAAFWFVREVSVGVPQRSGSEPDVSRDLVG